MSKLNDLAQKLQALATGGVGGEKLNAAKMLADLCRKHGINLDSLTVKPASKRLFPVETEEQLNFIAQCVSSVNPHVPTYSSRGGQGWFVQADLTDAEYLEAETKASFYWPIWKREKDLFYNAFVQKHGLARNTGGPSGLSATELAEVRRKMGAMDTHQLHKQLQ